jgi:hypothetical protein
MISVPPVAALVPERGTTRNTPNDRNAMSETTVFGSTRRRGEGGRDDGRGARGVGADRIDRGKAL